MRVTAYDISLNDRKEWCILYTFRFITGLPLILGLFQFGLSKCDVQYYIICLRRVGFDRPQRGQRDFDRWPSLGGRPDGRRQAHVGLCIRRAVWQVRKQGLASLCLK